MKVFGYGPAMGSQLQGTVGDRFERLGDSEVDTLEGAKKDGTNVLLFVPGGQ
jgi:hypothetical protein